MLGRNTKILLNIAFCSREKQTLLAGAKSGKKRNFKQKQYNALSALDRSG